jgi:protein phosphatase 1 regulatory subunit 3A/B/C/D/E
LPPTGPPITPSFKAPNSVPTIAPLFNQPSGSLDFFNNLRDKKVCLESAFMSDLTTIKGIVRVVNLDYNKRIVVRYTTDDWLTVSEAIGDYIIGSCDGFSDKFNIELDYADISGKVGRRLQVSIL